MKKNEPAVKPAENINIKTLKIEPGVHGNLAWPVLGSYKPGNSIMYFVPTGWRAGVIKEVGTIENKNRQFIPNEKKYLIDPAAFALSDDWYEWSQVVKVKRETFRISWFIGGWRIGEVMAHTNKIENGKETDTYGYADAYESLKVKSNNTFSWRQTNGKIIYGRWKPATNGPGNVLLKACSGFDWTVRNYTMPDDLHIRKLEIIRLHPSKNVGSVTGKRKAN